MVEMNQRKLVVQVVALLRTGFRPLEILTRLAAALAALVLFHLLMGLLESMVLAVVGTL